MLERSLRMYCAINSRELLRWTIFACTALLLCTLLSLRPISRMTIENDTERYVSNQALTCQNPVPGGGAIDPSARAFYILMRPLCASDEPRFFLFFTCFSLPLAFLLFGRWQSYGSLLIAIGFFFCTVGFELMTNALRQSVSLAFLVGALANKNRWGKTVLVFFALTIHSSCYVYTPLVFLSEWSLLEIAKRHYKVIMAIVIALVFTFFAAAKMLPAIGLLNDLVTSYQDKYVEPLSPVFIAFMVLPLFWVFLVLLVFNKGKLPHGETNAIIYSSIVFLIIGLLVSSMLYRFVMSSLVIQMFLAIRSSGTTLKVGALIFAGLIIHFAVYAFLSKNVIAVLHG